MKKPSFLFFSFTVLLLFSLLIVPIGCAKKVEPTPPVVKEDPLPPPPMEGINLAKAAERVPIDNGPASPSRRVLFQEPSARPCWALSEGKGCPLNKPGYIAFVGTSSGAATKEGAILNAYQNAIEMLAAHGLELSGKTSPSAREKARAKAYMAAGIHSKTHRLLEGTWVQKWEEKVKDSKRVYFRAFVLLVVSENEMNNLQP